MRAGRRAAVLAAALVLGFVATVLLLNATVFGPGGFVRSYLDALSRGDLGGALQLADVRPTAEDVLLDRDALGPLEDVRIVGDEALPDGTHRITASYVAGGEQGRTAFLVEPAPRRLLVFSGWRFAEAPLAELRVTVRHDQRFHVNGRDVVAAANQSHTYRVLAPGSYTLGHESRFLTAAPVPVAVTDVGATAEGVVDVQANERFVAEVQEELHRYLDDCATQQVLLPTGCPFGKQITNRIETTPQWSISAYPEVTLVPGAEAGTWLMPPTGAAARLVVDIRSLYDGTVTAFDEDVPFTVSYLIAFQADGGLFIRAQG